MREPNSLPIRFTLLLTEIDLYWRNDCDTWHIHDSTMFEPLMEKNPHKWPKKENRRESIEEIAKNKQGIENIYILNPLVYSL